MHIRSPAKINLFLHVTGKRADGYHNLLTLMCRVSLYDNITIEHIADRQGIEIRCSHPAVPADETNLAYRAADLFFRELARKPAFSTVHRTGGLVIAIEKNIPVGAGLGGGSSNAATVLSVLNRKHNHPFSDLTLREMGLSLGADVPFFLFGRPAIAQGVGELLQPYEKLRHFVAVLVCPRVSVSTAAVYKKLNLRLTKCEKKLKNFLFEIPVFDVGQHLCNDLETVTAVSRPEVPAIKQRLMALNARGALMSGSGPAVFGVFSRRSEARSACDRISKKESRQAWVVEPLL